MIDVSMSWSGDLSTSTTGDVATSSGTGLGTERVLRRLMTNPQDYLWNPDYGGGLGQLVGRPIDPASVSALIRSQMLLETAVAADPEPVIATQTDVTGQLFVQIRYADATTSEPVAVAINLPG